MKPNSLTVFELFERQQRYVVPLFQRPYVWSRERQWEALWEDIAAKADEVLNNQRHNHREPSKHFLGAIVLNPIKTSGLQVTAKSIIDGQQRLTTLQVILVALRDLMKRHSQTDLLSDIEIHTENRVKMEQPFERYKVWPTNADRAVFESIFECGSPEALREKYPPVRKKWKRKYEPNPRLMDAYLYFYEALSSYLLSTDGEDITDESDPNEILADRIRVVVEAFKRHLQIVTIDLDEQDNPQVIFETLNYRGEPLLPSDLIRNYVFLEATSRKADVQSLYDQYWLPYDAAGTKKEPNFWKEQESQGRRLRQRIDLFVFHYLVFKTEHEIHITRLYQEFRDWWRSENDRSVEEELRSLQEYSRLFKTLYQPEDESRMGMFKRRLRRLDITTVYPLLLLLMGEKSNPAGKHDLEEMAVDLESFLVRRLVCGLTTKNYNNVFLSLLRNLRKSEDTSPAHLRELLLEPTGDSARWPDDGEFKAAWLSRPLYAAAGSGRTRMILEALDLQLTTRKQEKVHLSGSLTVEHVLPRSWKEVPDSWPLAPAAGISNEQATAERDNILHTIGNLTLLTNALNPSVSNSAFAKKRPEIALQSALRLNSYFQTVSDPEVWSEAQIIERGERLFETALKVWPYPG